MSLKDLYLYEIQQELQKPQQVPQQLSEAHLEVLPTLLQTYLRKAGFLNKPMASNFSLIWENTYLKLKPDKDWMHIDCSQFNAATQPTRIALMQSKMLGIIPFAGKDKYQHSEGNMLIRLANFTVSNTKGPEMNVSALVTFLSESVLLPAALLSSYISWQQVDTHTLEATITDAGISATGKFYFDENGMPEKFETEDRFYSTGGSHYQKYTWKAYYLDYKDFNGFYLPSTLKAAWQLPEGEYTYFTGNIKRIAYGIEHISQMEV
ncbi:DUF6544 family protein [Pontibacter sp. H249]|uniref:DUF6544 family protein n=1 Tax=Pontibacter sp. H249 TaxID=3133420 RepID=UPI0030BF6BCE